MPDEYLNRTEPPSQKKLRDAKKKGFVAKSRDLTTAALLMATILIFYMSFEQISQELKAMTIDIWNHLNEPYDDIGLVSYWQMQGMLRLMKLLMWPFIGIFLLGMLFNVLQTGFIFSFYPLKPRWSNLNVFDPINYRKYFDLRTIVSLLSDFFKIIIIFFIFWKIVENDIFTISHLMQSSVLKIENYFFNMLFLLGICFSGAYLLLSFLDLGFQKWKFWQEMKMDVIEIQSLRQKAIKNRVEMTVPKAHVVLTSSSKYAIALQYDPERMGAPICVAVGANNKAIAIKNTALRYDVPIIDDTTLTKSLFFSAGEGLPIPQNFYYPIATLLINLSHKPKK
jgi:flagellar biosynthesis protein FlhB